MSTPRKTLRKGPARCASDVENPELPEANALLASAGSVEPGSHIGAGQRRANFIKFWKHLGPEEKRTVVAMTEEIPLDRGAGLWNIYEDLWGIKIWRCIEFNSQWASLLFKYLRMCLNVASAASISLRWCCDKEILFKLGIGETGSYILKHGNSIKICEVLPGKTLSQKECLHLSPGRWWCIGVVVQGEFVVCVLMAAIVITSQLLFLCGLRCGGKSLPERFPFFFLFFPKMASTFSCLLGLQFANLSRAMSLFVRNEARLWVELLLGRLDDPDHSERNWEEVPAGRTLPSASWQALSRIAAVCWTVVCLAASFQALLVKLTLLHFITVQSFSDWSPMEWVQAVGLVNCISGAFDIDVIEVHRLLLLKFGGADCSWQEREIHHVVSYFSIFTRRLHDVLQCKSSCLGSLRAVAALANWDCKDLQRQLLCDHRGAQLCESRGERLKFYNKMFGSPEAQDFARVMLKTTSKDGKKRTEKQLREDQLAAARERHESWVQEHLDLDADVPASPSGILSFLPFPTSTDPASMDPPKFSHVYDLHAEAEYHRVDTAQAIFELQKQL